MLMTTGSFISFCGYKYQITAVAPPDLLRNPQVAVAVQPGHLSSG